MFPITSYWVEREGGNLHAVDRSKEPFPLPRALFHSISPVSAFGAPSHFIMLCPQNHPRHVSSTCSGLWWGTGVGCGNKAALLMQKSAFIRTHQNDYHLHLLKLPKESTTLHRTFLMKLKPSMVIVSTVAFLPCYFFAHVCAVERTVCEPQNHKAKGVTIIYC